MLLNWFDATEAKQFGATLANFYIERNTFSVSNKTDKFAAKKQEELLDKVLQQVARFKLEHKLNIYTKAQVGNSFKWTLKEAGCDPQYVDQLTSWLMPRL